MNFYIKSILGFILAFLPQAMQAEESSASPPHKTVCLNMIVKNESKVMARCLQSMIPVIDYWVIVDTGSTDGTQEVIKEFMKANKVAGELIERPWINFAHNRNEALRLAKGKADYLFFIDADDYLIYEPNFKLPALDKDLYYVTFNYGGTKYGRAQLINDHVDWEWEGVLHEAIMPRPADSPRTSATLEGVVNFCTQEGDRSRDPQKYQKDAEVLEEALKKEPANTRYVFYLAQSYRDANNHQLALKNYEKRVAMGGWDEEIFISLLEIAKLQERLKNHPELVVKGYHRAYLQRPSRMEPLYYLSHYYRERGDYESAYRIARLGSTLPPSQDILFVENWIYDYGMPLELSACAYWTGHYEECRQLSITLLKKTILPDDIHKIVHNNLAFAHAKLDTPLSSIEKKESPQ